MENITLTIKPPITEYCTECAYEASRSFGSHLCKCPKCGKNSVSAMHRVKANAIYAHLNKAHYYIGNNEQQYKYSFVNLPEGYKSTYVIEEELECDDALELARELNKIISKYLYNGDKESIKKLVEYLESVEEEQYELRIKEHYEELTRELYELVHRNDSIIENITKG